MSKDRYGKIYVVIDGRTPLLMNRLTLEHTDKRKTYCKIQKLR